MFHIIIIVFSSFIVEWKLVGLSTVRIECKNKEDIRKVGNAMKINVNWNNVEQSELIYFLTRLVRIFLKLVSGMQLWVDENSYFRYCISSKIHLKKSLNKNRLWNINDVNNIFDLFWNLPFCEGFLIVWNCNIFSLRILQWLQKVN